MDTQKENINVKNNIEILDLIPITEGDKRIPFIPDDSGRGFSIVRGFNGKTKFKPALNASGEEDDVVLIRTGFYFNRVSDGKVPLVIDVSKASRYQLDAGPLALREDINPLAPTKESRIISNKSPQVIDLTEESRFILDLKTYKVFDTKDKKNLELSKVFDYIYDLFLSTAGWKGFISLKPKLLFSKVMDNLLRVTLIGLWDTLSVLGRKIKKDTTFGSSSFPVERESFFFWHSQSVFGFSDSVVSDSNVSLLGSEYKVSKSMVVILSILILALFYFSFRKGATSPFLSFLSSGLDNNLFVLSVIVILYFIIDQILPRIVIFLMNKLIKLRNYFATKRYKYY